MSQDGIAQAVSKRFEIVDTLHTENGLELVVKAKGDPKEGFLEVYRELFRIGYVPRLSRLGLEDRLLLAVEPVEKKSRGIPARPILLIAALATVLVDAYYSVGPYIPQLIYFALPAIVFIAVHEAVVLLVKLKEGTGSASYVIPGIPGIMPFMGFLNMDRTAVNRDRLFDMGFYPLLASFATLLVMLIAGSYVPPAAGGTTYITLVNYIFGPVMKYSSPIALGAAVSLATAFVNFMPFSPLDGGVVLEGMNRRSLALQFLSVVVISLLGYFVLALILIFMQGNMQVEVLDGVSELSGNRKGLYWALLALAIIAMFLMIIP